MSTPLPTRKFVAPLDPDSPAGRACADELTGILADVEAAVLARRGTARPERERQDEAA